MIVPGNVIRFWSQEADKPKHHLCVSQDGHFLFVNSPKKRTYPGDLIVPCSDFPFLDPTPSGNSIISCSLVLRRTMADLERLQARLSGAVSAALLQKVFDFIENNPVLSEEEREPIITGLGDWL